MDRGRGLIALSIAAAIACGPRGQNRGRPLRPGEVATSTPSGLRVRERAATGVLTYAVALDSAGRRLITVELSTRFELVVRRLGASGEVIASERTLLGPADWDVRDLALDPAGQIAWIASADGTVRAIELEGGRTRATWHLGDAATAVAVSRDGRHVATGAASGAVCLRRAEDGALLQCMIAHAGPVSAIDFSRDRLATGSWSGEVATWQVPSLAVLDRLRAAGSVNDVAFSPDGTALAIATSREPPLRTPAVAEREGRAVGAPDPLAVVQVLVSHGGRVTCSGHSDAVSSVAWTPDGGALVSGSWDRSIRLWDRTSGRELDRIGGLDHIVRGVATGANGRWAAAAAWAIDANEASSLLLDLLYTGN